MSNFAVSTPDDREAVTAFVVTVGVAEAEIASDRLWSLGVAAVEERPAAAPDHVELWTSVGSDPDRIDDSARHLDPTWTWRLEIVERSVLDSWRDHVDPILLAPGWIVVPSWRDDLSPPGHPSDHVVSIDPGDAFGMGDHPTTRATAQVMLRELSSGERVLDVGCGSGVLGICAALAGAREVLALDISESALIATRANSRRNGVDEWIRVTGEPLFAVEGHFDLILANLLAPILIELASPLRRILAPSGRLVVSGIFDDRYDHVLEALTPLEVVDISSLEGWAAITLRHPLP